MKVHRVTRSALIFGALSLLVACASAVPDAPQRKGSQFAAAAAAPLRQSSEIRFDARQVSHEFYGFGTQIWTTELTDSVLNALRALDIDYIRFSATPSNSDFGAPIPVDASPQEMDRFVRAHFDDKSRLGQAKRLFAAAREMNISTVLLIWAAPSPWLAGKKDLQAGYVDDFARLWGAIVQYMANEGMRPDYIELVNEPHGDWNTHIKPDLYSRLVSLTREDLDRRGLRQVGILGPGAASQVSQKWVDALDREARGSLAGWSAHNYERQDKLAREVFEPFASSARRAEARKPLFLTEYSSQRLRYGNREFPARKIQGLPRDQIVSYSPLFAVQVYQNTLSLINSGANSLFYWQLGDYSWSGEGNTGLIDRQGMPKPSFTALRTLFPKIPDHADVLRPLQTDAQITAAAFRHNDEIVFALANNTPQAQTSHVVISPSLQPAQVETEAFDNGQVMAKPVSLSPDGSGFTVSLPAWSTETVLLRYPRGALPK